MADITERIRKLQKHLGVRADGLIGPATLTAIENALGLADNAIAASTDAEAVYSLTISRRGLQQLIEHEISSKAYYRIHLQQPSWPGGASGVTIGIGYDLGYNSARQLRRDWAPLLSDHELNLLESVSGLRGDAARAALPSVAAVNVPLTAAEQVFFTATLPRYAADTRRAYPGVEDLAPDAQAALLSLIYNRGHAMSGGTRAEMRQIRPLVVARDYAGIAHAIRSMKRLWQGQGLEGLLRRREAEAVLVENAEHDDDPADLIRV